jgi:hypothetical protein
MVVMGILRIHPIKPIAWTSFLMCDRRDYDLGSPDAIDYVERELLKNELASSMLAQRVLRRSFRDP